MPSPFDDLAPIYDVLIDWPKRLAREEPFYRRLFEEVGVQRVLDAACGTGRHAAMFHEWSLAVEGADLSPTMIARARQRLPEGPRMKWVVRGYTQPTEFPGGFDAALCVGHSLALAPDEKAAAQAVRTLLDAVRPGGVVITQVLNLWALPEGPCLWQRSLRTRIENAEVVLIKGIHRTGHRGFVNLVVVPLTNPSNRHAESVPFLGLKSDQLLDWAHSAGATQAHVFGGYRQEPYIPDQSTDLILVARK